MKQDVLDALSGRFPKHIPCKESLNHPGIINRVAGFDVYDDTPQAYDIAWRKLGIDIHTSLPEGNATRPKVPGGTWVEGNRKVSDYGVHATSMPIEHMPDIDKTDDEWVYRHDPATDDFDLDRRIADLRRRNGAFREHFGDLAVNYHLYYTTLFMWPICHFDWVPFLTAAALDPDRFDRHFWEPWSHISRKHVESLCAMDEEVVFTHDDLAMTTGPVFPMSFYEKHIFSRYPYIWEPVVTHGKKLIFVIDGGIDQFLERFLDFPIAAVMYENPATSFDRVCDIWGKAGRGFIGGISTVILTGGTPDEVRRHTCEVIEQGSQYPGFIISSPGGLPGNIPMENVLAYFTARKDMGLPVDLTPGDATPRSLEDIEKGIAPKGTGWGKAIKAPVPDQED